MPRSCPVCGSRKWRRDGVTGNAVCEDGHVFQDFREENLVVEGTNYVLQKRTLKRDPRRNRRKETGNDNQEYYHGTDAEYLKVQAMQVLLRYQIQAMRKIWSLPDAFEMIVRDLWAYQLAMSPLPRVPEPTAATFNPDDQAVAAMINGEADDTIQDDGKSDDEALSGSSTSSKADDNADIDPELLAELSEESTDKEEQLREVSPSSPQHDDIRWRRKRKLRVSDTVVTLIVGLWVMRVPIMNVDIENLINDNSIPYIDYGHTTLLPPSMVKHINRDVMIALSPLRAPRPLSIHGGCRKLVRVISRRFSVLIPEVNYAPLAWRVISSLGGTPTTYAHVTRLLAVLDVNISLNDNDIEIHRRKPKGRGRQRYNDSSEGNHSAGDVEVEMTAKYQDVILPELSIAACWVMAMKMVYGLDGQPRQVLAKSDPAMGLPKSEKWIGELQRRLDDGLFKGSQRNLEKQDFTSMDLDGIDRYLTFCEQILLRDRNPVTDAASIPLQPGNTVPASSSSKSWDAFHAAAAKDTISLHSISSETANRALPLMPGEKMRSYESDDITGTLPRAYETILDAAAQVIGVDQVDVADVIELYERRLEKARIEGGRRSRSSSRVRGVPTGRL